MDPLSQTMISPLMLADANACWIRSTHKPTVSLREAGHHYGNQWRMKLPSPHHPGSGASLGQPVRHIQFRLVILVLLVSFSGHSWMTLRRLAVPPQVSFLAEIGSCTIWALFSAVI